MHGATITKKKLSVFACLSIPLHVSEIYTSRYTFLAQAYYGICIEHTRLEPKFEFISYSFVRENITPNL
jgi:hypothetical protein